MPYGGHQRRVNNYFKRNKSARHAKFTANRTANKAVRTIQRKPYVPKLAKNTASIRVLANQVRKLQSAQYGQIQSQILSWQLPAATSTPWDKLSLWRGSPVGFALNDFTEDARVYQVYTVADTTTDRINRLPWQKFNGVFGAGSQDASNMTYLKENSYWKTHQDNKASKEFYLPISSELQFEFSRSMVAGDETESVRIDIIRLKKALPKSAFENTFLPAGLIGLQHLAAKEMLDRNKINPAYFEIVRTKFLYFTNTAKQAANTDRRTIRRYFKHKQIFPRKVLKTDTEAYDENEMATDYMDDASWIDVMDPTKVYWCVINFSTTSESERHWDMSIQRVNKWRDLHGTN